MKKEEILVSTANEIICKFNEHLERKAAYIDDRLVSNFVYKNNKQEIYSIASFTFRYDNEMYEVNVVSNICKGQNHDSTFIQSITLKTDDVVSIERNDIIKKISIQTDGKLDVEYIPYFNNKTLNAYIHNIHATVKTYEDNYYRFHGYMKSIMDSTKLC